MKAVKTNLFSMSVHHPTGLTVEIVGIEASGNGRSCCQHDVCGSVLDDDVVVRLRKVQIINSSGKEETAIAAYLVSDGIDQCRVGFLQRHFVPHARSFDGVLAQVTEVYSITNDSPIKRKKCRHNMGCCLAALISELPPTANTISASTNGMSVNSFLRRVARQDEDEEEEEDTTRLLLQRNEAIINYDDPSSASTAAAPAAQQTTTNVATTQPPVAIIAPQHSMNSGRKADATRRLILRRTEEQGAANVNYDDPPSAQPAAASSAAQHTTTNVASIPPPAAAARVLQHSNSDQKNNDEYVRKRKVDDYITHREQDEEDNTGCS